jgi:hypothetical protein
MADVILVGSGDDTWTSSTSTGNVYFCKFTALYSGSVTSIKVHVHAGKSGNVKVAILSDNAGVPGTLLNQVGSTAVTAGWSSVSITATPVVAGIPYWLSFIGDQASFIDRTTSGGTAKIKTGQTYSTWTFASNPSTNFPDTEIYGIAGWGAILVSSSWAGTWGG